MREFKDSIAGKDDDEDRVAKLEPPSAQADGAEAPVAERQPARPTPDGERAPDSSR